MRAVLMNRKMRWWIFITTAVVLSPVAYVLSCGPLVWMEERYPNSQDFTNIAICPMRFAQKHGVFKFLRLEDALNSYNDWWWKKALKGGGMELE